jgi:isopentenyl-diphosphate Delta-isomerase
LRDEPPDQTSSRKADHLRINIDRDVAAKGVAPGFDDYAFAHRALPEIDFDEVDTSTEFLGRRLAAPLLVSCMTGGTPQARDINRRLARVAQSFGFAMGLGSGRALIEAPDRLPSFEVRSEAPGILLFANLGAVQLNKGYDIDECRRLVELLQADALVLHCNPLQEALQPEGDSCFRGLLGKIEHLCAQAEFPIVVKEVGWGIGVDQVRALFDAGVAAVDLAGAGGTSWSEVERHRIAEPWRARVAAEFAGWGIPTARCLIEARAVAPNEPLIASGGVRSGLDAAKALALGADLVGLAGPFLRAADRGEETAAELARELVETLRVAMFCVGARRITELHGTLS